MQNAKNEEHRVWQYSKDTRFLSFGSYILIISIRFASSGTQYSFQTDFFAPMMQKERLVR